MKKKKGCIVAFAVLIAIIIGVVIGSSISTSSEEKEKKYLIGIDPNSICNTLNDLGYTSTQINNNDGYGHLYVSELKGNGVTYRIQQFAQDDAGKLNSISVTVIKDVGFEDEYEEYVNALFDTFAKLNYAGSEPDKACTWVSENIDKEKSSEIIGGKLFTIINPTKYVKILSIEGQIN